MAFNGLMIIRTLIFRLHQPNVQYGYTQNGKVTFVKNLQLNEDQSGARSHSFQIDVSNNKNVNVSISYNVRMKKALLQVTCESDFCWF